MLSVETVARRYQQVNERIAEVARAAGRPAEAVRLVVVSKGHPVERIQEVIEAGALRLGENYVEEVLPKMAAFAGQKQLEWHMIGHVQSRKAQAVVENFHYLHSLDSVKLARRLDRFGEGLGRKLPALLECNVSGESSKYGFPAWEEAHWERLAEEIRPILELPSLEICGLMTMAPFDSQPESARPFFHRLRAFQRFLSRWHAQVDWRELSMGMSADFEIAIQEGATLVRIGTAILGERPE
jgi:pyridoxal phosphate enzyme (YggS family)